MNSSGSSWPQDGKKNDGSAGDRSEHRTGSSYNNSDDSPNVESEGDESESEETEGGSSDDESSHGSDDGDSDDNNSDGSRTYVNSTTSGLSSDSRFSSATTLVWDSEDDDEDSEE